MHYIMHHTMHHNMHDIMHHIMHHNTHYIMHHNMHDDIQLCIIEFYDRLYMLWVPWVPRYPKLCMLAGDGKSWIDKVAIAQRLGCGYLGYLGSSSSSCIIHAVGTLGT